MDGSGSAIPRRAFVSGLAGVLAAACGDSGSSPRGGEQRVLVAQGVRREAVRGAPVAATVDGMAAFAHRMYRASAKPAENTVLSPLSLAVAFAMARAGAKGATAAELDAVFEFPNERTHAALNQLTRDVVTHDVPPPAARTRARKPSEAPDAKPAPPVVCLANGLFVQHDQPVREEFLRILAAHYGAGVRTVDFTAPTAPNALNEWVRKQTADRIKKLFDSLDPRTKVVLANALYLKAEWVSPFDDAVAEPFTRADGGTVRTPTMSTPAHQSFRYAAGAGWQAVELPYAGGELAMWVLVPERGRAPAELLTPATLAGVATTARQRRVKLTMPCWDFETGYDLEPALTTLGLTRAFGPGADFSGIAAGLWIGQAVHRARITVDEWGTEAAAVTGIAMVTSMPPPPEITVRADRPFAFSIMHKPTRTPLFLGHVADPAKTG